MKPKSYLFPAILIACLAMSAFSSDIYYPNDTERGWTVPDCDFIKGTRVVTFTTDEGLTMTELVEQHRPTYTYGLVALDLPNTLLACRTNENQAVFERSEDAGCTWDRICMLNESDELKLVAGRGDTVYGWIPGRSRFYRLEGAVITPRTAPGEIRGFAVSSQDAMNIRIGTATGRIFESQNGGVNFALVGQPAPPAGNPDLFTVDFNPENWDQVLCGGIGAWRTTDACQTWTEIAPFDSADGDVVHRFVFSTADPQRVWARANLDAIGGIRAIFVSDDGGASFTPRIEQGTIVQDQNGIPRTLGLPNSPNVAAHPVNKDILYFTTASTYDNYGTDFWRYEMMGDNLTVNHIDGLDGIDATAFNPADPSVMYLGLRQVWISLDEAKDADLATRKTDQVAVAPNPFNPLANIALNLMQSGQVKIEVYNVTGQKVGTVVDANLSAGEHSYTWDGSAFASGVYLLRVQTGTEVQTKKLVLLK
ncbi:MAG: T9SS type A sorting domain-containing protein [Candidatus Zixiibacteriota bacterium]|nr:MAG: T9SS type A sorting domain-containing protein [candidate division Zixibacteria bacterium]